MYGDAPKSHLTGVPGWETQSEQDLLASLAQAANGGPILEIGGEFGMSSSIFAKFAPESKVYSMDIRFDGELGGWHALNLQEAGIPQEQIVRIAADSHAKATFTRAKKLIGGELALLFVDGDHSLEGAYQDLVMWSPLVKVGGILALHDVACETNRMPHIMHFDVTTALSRFMAESGGAWASIDMQWSTVAFKRVK